MKGYFSGGLWALVLGGSGLGIASLVGEQPRFAEGPAAPQLTVPVLENVTPGPAVAFESSSDATPQFTPTAPLDALADVAENAPEVSTEPAALPQTAEVDATIVVPNAIAESGLASDIEAPAVPRTDTALVAPAIEEAVPPIVDNTPAVIAPIAPTEDVSNVPTITEADSVVAEEETALVTEQEAPVEDNATDPVVTADEPVAAVIPDAPVDQATSEPVVTEEETVAEASTPIADPVEEPTQGTPVDVLPTQQEDATPPVTAQIPETPPAEPDVAVIVEPEPTVVGDAAQDEPAAVAEALPQTNAAVRINRPTEAVEEPDTPAVEPPVADAIPDDAPALRRYAVPFAQGEADALISIILIDEGQMPDAPAAVGALGFVSTVAINGLSSASGDLAAAYRAAGVEVAMQADLPDGAQPSDVEVAFEAALGMVPEVTMLFSDGTGAMQNRAVTEQVMQILETDGYGFVTVQRGLSNAARAADQAGVVSTTVLRDIDGAGEDTAAIVRALDQAAFRARQTGEAVLLGRVMPETLAALQAWAADVDRETLAIAPVSAVLLRAE
ncbi:polysaccharide deacetylase 2 family uncharacterized protein YibQ [Yoonia maricola]|uniref:Polysaccharide deacetylase 2 family uncharacterized protein YibQ n=1 Tax=Yoonia maricola TaxID=420999 RepID=A0A2M8WL02_9RHOB|nr:divergent polysaccharide deacetylase family protein [Yoonia maricola]PJI91605.1 polysaccharide deacetylase 2 family uncharacterized protein YibQ [Yoonia maricola]